MRSRSRAPTCRSASCPTRATRRCGWRLRAGRWWRSTPTASSRRGTRELGRGVTGVVCPARDPRLTRSVAIKAVSESFTRDPARLARFEREGRLLASLDHPTVAGIHGIEECDGRRYLVLEYVDGET